MSSAITAARVAAGDSGALTEPLLGSSNDETSGEGREGLSVEDEKTNNCFDNSKFLLVFAGGLGSMGAAGASMAILRKMVLYVAGAVNCIVAPPVIFREAGIAKNRSLRGYINLLRMEVNRLMVQNDILSNEIDNLETEVERLQVFEDNLTRIADAQGTNVTKLVRMVEENGEIVKEMKKIVRGKILQDMIQVILSSDKNQDFLIDEHELYILTMRLKTMFEAQGISMDTDLFQELVRFNPTLEGVLNTAKELVSEDEDNDVLFKFTDGNKLRDSVMKSFRT